MQVQRAKESTARVVGWRELGIANSYTLEASFAGVNFGQLCGRQYTQIALEEIGHAFCETCVATRRALRMRGNAGLSRALRRRLSVLDYCDPDQFKVREAMSELERLYPRADVDYSDDTYGRLRRE